MTASEVSYRVERQRRKVKDVSIGYNNSYDKGFLYIYLDGPVGTLLFMVGQDVDGLFNPYYRVTPTGPVLNTGVFKPGPPAPPNQDTMPAEHIAIVYAGVISAPYDINSPYYVGLGDSVIRITCDTDEDRKADEDDKGE